MSVFEQLAEKENQVMVTTHSPYFVSGRAFEHVRMVRNSTNSGEATISSTTFDAVAARLAVVREDRKPATPTLQQVRLQQALQPALNEMFFSPVVVFVEGLEDVAYLTSCLILTNKWEEFRRLGCHFVPVAGKGEMVQPIIMAQEFGLPCFVIFDSDSGVAESAEEKASPATDCAQCKETAKQRQDTAASRVTFHRTDNERILKALGYEKEPAFPTTTVWKDNLVAWKYNIHTVLAEDVGGQELQTIEDRVRNEKHLVGDGDIKKHELLIGYVLESLYSDGKKAVNLEKVCDRILAFAKQPENTIPTENTIPIS
jgi:predicted ATP-dependent endonuclease of OLD family